MILTSDNGPETTSVIHMRADHGHDGARPWRGMKRDNWQGGHRVPFIVQWPAKAAERPEIVQELAALLEQSKSTGRSWPVPR